MGLTCCFSRFGFGALKRQSIRRELTFKQVAERFLDAHEASWKNSKHRQLWRSTLDTYVHPVLGDTPIAEIDTTLVQRRQPRKSRRSKKSYK